MEFQEKVIQAIKMKNSVLVVGLDPNLDLFPQFLLKDEMTIKEKADAIYRMNTMVIDVVYDICVAVKPQLAYYEVFGSEGIKALEKTILYAKTKDLLVINDAKRGDIGSTCDAYAEAFLTETPLSGDAVTVNPFLGSDGIIPFIEKANKYKKGVFILVKTSNPSSSELQNLELKSGDRLYGELAKGISKYINPNQEKYSNVGVVVGATYPEEAAIIREHLPKSFFLVPGFGTQGAKAENLASFFDENGYGALISSSRGIMYPYLNQANTSKDKISEKEYLDMVTKVVEDANNEINLWRKCTKL